MSPFAVLPDRLKQLDEITLLGGDHTSFEAGVCAMEAVAWLAGEKHSDRPKCACPVLGEMFRTWNDQLPTDAERDRLLKPLLPRLVGSRSTLEVERRRADLALDWVVRTHTATWLDKIPALQAHAAKVRALRPLLSIDAITEATLVLVAAATAVAWAAARAAARAAVEATALAKKVDVSGLSYREAYDAASPACVALFAPTRDTLERSALELIEQMLAVTPESLALEAVRVSSGERS